MTVTSVPRSPRPRLPGEWPERHPLLTALLAVAILLAVGVAAGASIGWVLVALWNHSGLVGAGTDLGRFS
jgi:hypothetical protein